MSSSSDWNVEVDKSWILNYAAREAEAERAAAAAARAQVSAAARWEAMTPEEKLERLEASYQEETRKAKDAKESGRLGRREKAEMEARLKDIREQMSELRVIVGQRRQEMRRLKEQLLADMQQQEEAWPALQSTQKKVEEAQAEDVQDFGGMFGDDDDDEEEEREVEEAAAPAPAPAPATAPATAAAAKAKEAGGAAFEQSVVDGLFGGDDDSSDDEAAAAAELEARRRERRAAMATEAASHAPAAAASPPVSTAPPPVSAPAAPSSPDRAVPGPLEAASVPARLEPAAASTKGGGRGKGKAAKPACEEAITPVPATPPSKSKLEAGVPKNWSGKTPRRVLEEHLQKRKLGRAVFQRPGGNSSRDNGCVLTLKLTTAAADAKQGQQKQKQQQEQEVVLTFESRGEFAGHGDAQHAAATRAMYHLEPMLQLHRVLPPPFRAWWSEWSEADRRRREEATAAVRRGKKDRIQGLLQSMREVQLEQPPGGAEEGEAAPPSFGLPDTTDLSWEEQAEGIDEGGEEEEEQGGAAGTAEAQLLPQPRGPRRGDDNALGERLRERFQATRRRADYQALAAKRAELPVAATRAEILACIQKEQVVVISGETGCGKSTQVSQRERERERCCAFLACIFE